MTQPDPTASNARGAQPTVRYRGRHLPMVAVVLAATIATALAYSGMVLFGLEVAHMTLLEAYGLAGFLEVSLVAVALMARNAALEGRPYGVLLTLTWVLSGTSGFFAALHQIAVPDATTPYMVAFRFVPPLVAALMWHLALVGERHLVTGNTLDERRREHRVHEYVTALELWRDARVDSTGDRNGMRKVRVAHQRQRAARDSALRMLTVEDFERRMQVWVERLEAAERHGSRLDRIGASSVKRGVSAGSEELVLAPAAVELAPARVPASGPALAPAPREVAAEAPFAEVFEEALAEAAPARDAVPDDGAAPGVEVAPGVEMARGVEVAPVVAASAGAGAPARAGMPESDDASVGQDAPRAAAAAVRADVAARDGVALEPVRPLEPLPETGHTRRVELFDLVREGDPAEGGATAARSAFFSAYGTPTSAVPVVRPHEEDVADEADGDTADGEQSREDRDRLIVELAGQGLTQREIAEQVSVSRTTVSRVLRAADSEAGLQLTRA